LFYMMRFGAGIFVLIGALMFIFANFVPRSRELIAGHAAAPMPAE